MTDKIKEFKNSIKNKRITVIGIGISNIPLIGFLLSCNAQITACDKKDKNALGSIADDLLAKGVTLRLGEDYLDNIDADIIFKTPGMRFDTPALLKAAENGSLITSEMEEFLKLCPAKIFAVTGSDGKTTTTTLIYKLLSAAGFTCFVGGNIGTPLLDKIEEIKPSDYVVLELSSFQLHTVKNSPHTAVITNLSPNHLDVHKSYEEYIDAKKNIMRFQSQEDTLVLNKDNKDTAALIPEAKGKCVTFSSSGDADVCLCGDYITFRGEKILKTSDIKIPGKHNVENYMAAISAVYPLVSKEIISEIARTFGGVEHRIELVRTLDGVKYYNSSIDSSPNRTINTLKVFSDPVILISGGKAKGLSYDEIGAPILEKAKALILIGATAPEIEKAVLKAKKKMNSEKDLPIYYGKTYEEVVHIAKDIAIPGDVVLLSNASTSFDMFKNFEERGNTFKNIVNSL